MVKLLFWLSLAQGLCGVVLASIALITALSSHGDVAVVRSWIEFGMGVLLAGCGFTLLVVHRREAPRSDASG